MDEIYVSLSRRLEDLICHSCTVSKTSCTLFIHQMHSGHSGKTKGRDLCLCFGVFLDSEQYFINTLQDTFSALRPETLKPGRTCRIYDTKTSLKPVTTGHIHLEFTL